RRGSLRQESQGVQGSKGRGISPRGTYLQRNACLFGLHLMLRLQPVFFWRGEYFPPPITSEYAAISSSLCPLRKSASKPVPCVTWLRVSTVAWNLRASWHVMRPRAT